MQSYQEFIDLSVGFPQEGFEILDDELHFHDLNLMDLIETYGTPLRFTYLPIVSKKIGQAKLFFEQAILKNDYRGSYTYCYCTKSSHFKHIIEEALSNKIHLETSSAFDLPMIASLEKRGIVKKDLVVICNGFKTTTYKQYICDLIHGGFTHILPVLDNKEEFNFYQDELGIDAELQAEFKAALRLAHKILALAIKQVDNAEKSAAETDTTKGLSPAVKMLLEAINQIEKASMMAKEAAESAEKDAATEAVSVEKMVKTSLNQDKVKAEKANTQVKQAAGLAKEALEKVLFNTKVVLEKVAESERLLSTNENVADLEKAVLAAKVAIKHTKLAINAAEDAAEDAEAATVAALIIGKSVDKRYALGIRVASDEQPDSQFYTSRLGVRMDEVIEFYHHKIAGNSNFKLTLLHFFINSGIADTPYYWAELEKYVELYCKFKKINPDLTTLDIGGGFPFKDSLAFDFDYEYMVGEILKRIKEICDKNDVIEPDLITEFGKYTVAEASGILYKVLGRKQQNDKERWLMIDGSFITNLPDVWALNQKYIVLPVNNWDAEYERINLGGMTCDGQDYYNQEAHKDVVNMPKTRKVQYIGFFHTGAYQDVLSGYGGIHHCLMPTPKHIIIRRNRDETFRYEVFGEEQNSKQVMKLLGYA